jgi:hypothetical protein
MTQELIKVSALSTRGTHHGSAEQGCNECPSCIDAFLNLLPALNQRFESLPHY